MTFLNRFFQLLIPGLTPVSLLESQSGFEIFTRLADTGKRPVSHVQSMLFINLDKYATERDSVDVTANYFSEESVVKVHCADNLLTACVPNVPPLQFARVML
jgi:hypothetical protein